MGASFSEIKATANAADSAAHKTQPRSNSGQSTPRYANGGGVGGTSARIGAEHTNSA